MKDIYNGETVSCWEEDDVTFVSFPWCTVNFPTENAEEVFQELSDLKKSAKRKAKKAKEKVVLDEKPKWEEQINSIIEKSGFGENIDPKKYEEKIKQLVEYFGKEHEGLTPSEDSQMFLNSILFNLMANESVLGAVTLAFKIGQVFQVHRNEFEQK